MVRRPFASSLRPFSSQRERLSLFVLGRIGNIGELVEQAESPKEPGADSDPRRRLAMLAIGDDAAADADLLGQVFDRQATAKTN